ncbi:NAD(P)-binding protein [Streptomyces sp. SP17KL33]|uniref:NAD(P)-binding protein n=1 Tax=Streptomyces sp. SP17KL33 TaxID=3002534 RepID=UPI002E77E386|nr:NAD(P)-binding protein [Streptomyces sp. SP17KL33]MEE1831717.1 NAD(P)-binding protein [Streptomyces sp. SP17KL33]
MLAIVGSGLSGAAVAHELGMYGIDHVLLDAGPHLGLDHVGAFRETDHLANPAADPSFAPFVAGQDSPYGPLAGYRMRVGGRGLYWRGISLRIEPGVLSGWPERLRRALEETWYPAVEQELANWSGRALAEPRTMEEEQLLAHVGKAGYQVTATPRAVRFSEDGRWSAYSPITAVAPDRIRARAQVSHIKPLPQGGFLVHGAGEPLAVDGIVLAAGVFENARLVDRLLGSRSEMRIVDHVATGFVVFRFGARHDPCDASVFAGFHPTASSNLFVESQAVDGGVLVDAWAMGEQPPEAAGVLADGNVTLDASARQVLTQVGYHQQQLLSGLADALDIGAVHGDGLGFDAAMTRAISAPGSAFGYTAGIGELDHESSGLPLGGDLVDEAGALRAIPGIHVVGPCLFPRAGAANPTLTNLALARYVAQSVIRSHV